MVIFEARFGFQDSFTFNKSPMKWRQRPDMTIAVERITIFALEMNVALRAKTN